MATSKTKAKPEKKAVQKAAPKPAPVKKKEEALTKASYVEKVRSVASMDGVEKLSLQERKEAYEDLVSDFRSYLEDVEAELGEDAEDDEDEEDDDLDEEPDDKSPLDDVEDNDDLDEDEDLDGDDEDAVAEGDDD